jgi:predicted Zn-dependent protease
VDSSRTPRRERDRPTRRRVALAIGGAILAALVIVSGLAPGQDLDSQRPRVPKLDGEVLERLPAGGAASAGARELGLLRRRLRDSPRDLELAVRVARLDIEQARATSDPRHLGHAQAALAAFWDEPAPPLEALILRATIRQSLHDFDGALRDLDQAARRAPGEPQVWLTRAVILTVRGRYPEALESCGRLEPLSAELVSVVCRTTVASLTGQARAARQELARVIDGAARSAPEERAWAQSTLGEIAVRAGEVEGAERAFRAALEIDPNDRYTLAVYADLLLDGQRPREVVALLASHTSADALLLRLAIAEKRSSDGNAAASAALLRERFEAGARRGDDVHGRERARFELEIEERPRAALEAALANWRVQHEPADARLVLEAALAAAEPEKARPVLDFLAQTRLEDPALLRLALELEKR